jgi:hypothetical protein
MTGCVDIQVFSASVNWIFGGILAHTDISTQSKPIRKSIKKEQVTLLNIPVRLKQTFIQQPLHHEAGVFFDRERVPTDKAITPVSAQRNSSLAYYEGNQGGLQERSILTT